MDIKFLNQAFLSQLDISTTTWIFDWIPDISFFAKDLDGKFVMCNKKSLELFGIEKEDDFLGKTDFDFVNDEIAESFLDIDRKVIKTSKPILNQIEPVPDNSGFLSWYSTSKIPLFDSKNKVIGIAVILRDVTQIGAMLGPYEKMSQVVEYIYLNYQEQITISYLAELANLSIKQLERKFKKLFGRTPLRFIHEHRINMACKKLLKGDSETVVIAREVGFYDQAHFNRVFKSVMNTTPMQYLKSSNH